MNITLFSCHPALRREARSPKEALRPVRFFYPKFRDDMDISSLAWAIIKNFKYLDKLDPDYEFRYGDQKITCQQVRDSQAAFLDLILSESDPGKLSKAIRKDFRVFRATGRDRKKKVLFTGYFEPTYEGSLIPDEVYRYPLYRKPEDMIKVDLSLFHEKYEGESITARIKDNSVLPYYSREQIENEKALSQRGLEIAWLKDPVDVTFLHIQGSGRLRLPDGEIRYVGYEASNGRQYHSIGGYMLDKGFLTREEMSMQSIRQYLSDNPDIVDEVLNHNPSYVFFRLMENGPFGNIDVQLTPGRSLALDSRLFPKGALCFISCEKPIIDNEGNIKSWTGFSRFIMNQDTGGAIKGAGRADIFWGNDEYAELAAGHLKHEGELYILIKKDLD